MEMMQMSVRYLAGRARHLGRTIFGNDAGALTLEWIVIAGLLGLSVLRESWVNGRVWMAGVRAGRMEVAWSSCPIKRQSIAYNMSYPEGNASLLVARRLWRKFAGWPRTRNVLGRRRNHSRNARSKSVRAP